jgi:hypothetical protein
MKSSLVKSSIAVMLAGFAAIALAGSAHAQESVNNLVTAIGEGSLPPNLNQDTQAAQAALQQYGPQSPQYQAAQALVEADQAQLAATQQVAVMKQDQKGAEEALLLFGPNSSQYKAAQATLAAAESTYETMVGTANAQSVRAGNMQWNIENALPQATPPGIASSQQAWQSAVAQYGSGSPQAAIAFDAYQAALAQYSASTLGAAVTSDQVAVAKAQAAVAAAQPGTPQYAAAEAQLQAAQQQLKNDTTSEQSSATKATVNAAAGNALQQEMSNPANASYAQALQQTITQDQTAAAQALAKYGPNSPQYAAAQAAVALAQANQAVWTQETVLAADQAAFKGVPKGSPAYEALLKQAQNADSELTNLKASQKTAQASATTAEQNLAIANLETHTTHTFVPAGRPSGAGAEKGTGVTERTRVTTIDRKREEGTRQHDSPADDRQDKRARQVSADQPKLKMDAPKLNNKMTVAAPVTPQLTPQPVRH